MWLGPDRAGARVLGIWGVLGEPQGVIQLGVCRDWGGFPCPRPGRALLSPHRVSEELLLGASWTVCHLPVIPDGRRLEGSGLVLFTSVAWDLDGVAGKIPEWEVTAASLGVILCQACQHNRDWPLCGSSGSSGARPLEINDMLSFARTLLSLCPRVSCLVSEEAPVNRLTLVGPQS